MFARSAQQRPLRSVLLLLQRSPILSNLHFGKSFGWLPECACERYEMWHADMSVSASLGANVNISVIVSVSVTVTVSVSVSVRVCV